MTSYAVLPGHRRLDDVLGIQERVELMGPDHEAMFVAMCEPVGRARGAIILCPSLFADFALNYRREVLLARLLAASGLAVLRFHYRGTGNSGGDQSDVEFNSLVEDVFAGMGYLEAEGWPSSGIRLVGVRWGAVVAAEACVSMPSVPLAFWEPVTSFERYFREAGRACLARSLVRDDSGHMSHLDVRDEVLRHGVVDVLGYPVHRPIFESSMERSLQRAVGDEPRRVLLIEPEGSHPYKREYESLTSRWRGRGFDVDVRTVTTSAAWWAFDQRPLEAEETARALADHIEGWAQ